MPASPSPRSSVVVSRDATTTARRAGASTSRPTIRPDILDHAADHAPRHAVTGLPLHVGRPPRPGGVAAAARWRATM